jgi:DNA-binding NarL/FixJ family response regulator
MEPKRILIADDHELIRRGLAAQVAQVPEWTVVAQAVDGREAVELAAKLKPDVIVMDLTMPRLDGLASARQILAADPSARILILSAHESEQLVREVLSAGVRGYVLKSDAGTVLISALQALLDDRPFYTSKVARMVVEGYLRSGPEGSAAEWHLTPREQEIVQLLAKGKTNKEVARALRISVKTAETHRSNIMRKTGCDSLAALVRYAIRNKLIEP